MGFHILQRKKNVKRLKHGGKMALKCCIEDQRFWLYEHPSIYATPQWLKNGLLKILPRKFMGKIACQMLILKICKFT